MTSYILNLRHLLIKFWHKLVWLLWGIALTLPLSVPVLADLSHRKANLAFVIKDKTGQPLPEARLTLKMKRHAFRFGTQIRDGLVAVSQDDFEALSTNQKQNLLPNLTEFGIERYTPNWLDIERYKQTLWKHFNHVVPTIGLQWLTYNSRGPAIPDAVISSVKFNGMSVTGASVVWPRDRWPTPLEFRSGSAPINAQSFHEHLAADRLSETGIIGRYSGSGGGPNISDWKLLNEPMNNSYYADVFVGAGFYSSNTETFADFLHGCLPSESSIDDRGGSCELDKKRDRFFIN